MWKFYRRDQPDWMNTITTIDEEKGYWVNFDSAGDGILTINGSGLIQTSIQLHKGWNLVGYPSLRTNKILSDALAGLPWDMVQRCDQGFSYNLKDVSGTDLMEPGKGYWIHVTSDCTWVMEPW